MILKEIFEPLRDRNHPDHGIAMLSVIYGVGGFGGLGLLALLRFFSLL